MSDPTAGGQEIVVRVADLNIATGQQVLVTYGLGSCVAILLFEPQHRIAAMAHIMLPSLSLARRGDRPGKTPHTAVPALIEAMVDLGAERKKINSRLVGGASLFASLTPPGSIQMGERNVVSCREVLNREGIPLVAEQVGGESGRSVWLYASDGRAIIRSASQSEQLL
jgi:chemotaxis protein CheD